MSLLRSGGRVSRIERSSLPVGILRDVAFERSADTLVDGDILLLLSDGATTAGIGWAEEMLRDFDPKTTSLGKLCESMADTARKKQQGEREDDITVMALLVKRVKNRD